MHLKNSEYYEIKVNGKEETVYEFLQQEDDTFVFWSSRGRITLKADEFTIVGHVRMPIPYSAMFALGSMVKIIDETSPRFGQIGKINAITFYSDRQVAYELVNVNNRDPLGSFSEKVLEVIDDESI